MVQVPAVINVTVPEEIVQTSRVAEARTTDKPVVAVAATTKVPVPKVLLPSEEKLIVCKALEIVNVTCVALELR